MAKLEKAIKELRWLQFNFPWQDNPENDAEKMSNAIHKYTGDAIELLESQQPRVLTLEEVRLQTWDYCYIEAEVKPHSKMLETLCGTHRLYCTTSIMLEKQTRGDEEYGKTWRCWTAKPTDEQRKAAKWDG